VTAPGRIRDREPATGSSSATGGFSLIELIIAVVVLLIVVGGALGFLSTQSRAFRQGLDRMSALQTVRFAVQTLEIDLAPAGNNVASGQPTIVYADDDVFAVNADYATSLPADPFAVYYDPDLPAGQVVAPTTGADLPNTSFSYPDTAYQSGGALSPAELLIFFFSPDASTARSDDYALYRQVNHAAPELVARRLLPIGSEPFFRYMTGVESTLDTIPAGSLPLAHSVPIHGSAADTGSFALLDDIRAVQVAARATNGRPGEAERFAELTRTIHLPNAEGQTVEACGASPILGTGIAATAVTLASGDPAVDLNWGQAIDEAGGEADVVRYVVWRREVGGPAWEDPYLSIPAGEPNYTYSDASVESGVTYEYGLAAQDCTPTLSSIATSATVTIP